MMKFWAAVGAILLVATVDPAFAHISTLDIEDCIKPLPPGDTAPLFSGLGRHEHPIRTHGPNSEKAQAYFNQGVALLYAFNHPEAIHSFVQAALFDSTAPMSYWGIAMAAGPDINTGATDACLRLAVDAITIAIKQAQARLQERVTASGRDLDATRLATALADGKEGVVAAALDGADNALRMAVRELGYATALAKRYRRDAGSIRADHEAYAAAMGSHAARFPDDLDAATLYSAALMNLTPWKWWVKGEPSAAISEAHAVLRRVLERDPLHLGANHYFIHATEESPHPEDALPSARRLAALAPAAGHILHMPSHIYRRTGQHAEATAANYTAVAVDRAYIRQTPATDRYPLHYLSHNLHFLTASLSIEGRESEAIAAAMDLLENALAYSGGYNEKHNQALAKTKDDYFFTVPILTAARFNRWRSLRDVEEKIINQRSTSIHPELHFTRAMLAYAGSLQYLAGGSVSESGVRRWIETLVAAARAAPKDLTYGTNRASDLFEIAAWVLVARSQEAIKSNIQDLISDIALPIDLSLLSGDRHTIGIKAWEQAVKRENRLDYNEPSDWYYPVRESLGAAHYRRGNFSAAEAVFRKDLEINRGNGRSLFGLIESLRAQGKPVPERLTLQFREAWKNATVKLSLETM